MESHAEEQRRFSNRCSQLSAGRIHLHLQPPLNLHGRRLNEARRMNAGRRLSARRRLNAGRRLNARRDYRTQSRNRLAFNNRPCSIAGQRSIAGRRSVAQRQVACNGQGLTALDTAFNGTCQKIWPPSGRPEHPVEPDSRSAHPSKVPLLLSIGTKYLRTPTKYMHSSAEERIQIPESGPP